MKDKGQKTDQTQTELQTLKARVGELENNWKRALADYKNLEARTEKQRFEAVIFANRNLVRSLLKTLDDLDLAYGHHQNEVWLKSIRDELKQVIIDEGVVEIDVAGKTFDPLLMECVGQAEGEVNKVVKIVQKGYKMHDTILRPARVEVGAGQNEQTNKSSNEQKN